MSNLTICLIVFLASCFLYSYLFFIYRIVDKSVNNGTNQTSIEISGYDYGYNEFNDTNLKKSIEIFVYVIRDGVCSLVLIGFNIIIFYKVKTAMKNKQAIIREPTHANNTNKNKLKSSKRKTAFMVIFISISYTIGRLPFLIYSITNNFLSHPEFFSHISIVCIMLSYDSYFFIYYFFNNRFRNLFKSYFSFNKCRQ